MLGKKLLRTMKLYKAQFISMILMVALGTGVLVGFNMEWMSLEHSVNKFYEQTGFANYRVYDDLGISSENRDEIKDSKGIDDVSRVFTTTADVKGTKGDTLSLVVTENPKVNGFQIMKGGEYNSKSTDDILLAEKYAVANNVKIGDEMTLNFNGKKFKGEVSALVKSGEHAICVRDMTQIMPDYRSHGFAYISPKALEDVLGMEYYPSLFVTSKMSEEKFTDLADDVFGKSNLILTEDDAVSYAGPQGEIKEGKTMAGLLPPMFLIIAFLTMMSTMNRIVAKEKIQIGTLKALGFKDRRILRHYTSYSFVVGIIGSLLGVGLGYLIGYMIDNPDANMGLYVDIPVWELVFPTDNIPVLVAIVLLLALIGFLSTKKVLMGTPAETLRPYVPKNIKAMSFENAKFFQKLSFGSRWNMRDTLRHKARTLMSILGVVGCMVIILGVLGMRDSVTHYIDGYYEDSMNYQSRIYLSESISDSEYEDLMDEYDGDSSANVGMDLDGKSIIMEIHHSEDKNDAKVKFALENGDKVHMGDEGVYVCMRLAKEHNLKKGDEITLTPFGTDDDYKMKVAGIMRNINESFFMSSEYADKIDLPYKADSIYTDTLKEDIDDSDIISSVQSREMISASFDSFMEIMYYMIGVLIVVGMLLGVVVLYNLGTMMYTERYRELATLKVLGFKDKKIANILHGQTLWTTVLGVILGLPVGVLALDYLNAELGERYEMVRYISPKTYAISILLTLGVSLFVSMLTARKSRKIDMVSSLKGIE